MAMIVSDGEWHIAEHFRVIDAAVTKAVEERQEKIIVIDAPPRHGKSELISKFLPAWYLSRFPKRHVILATYGADFARTWGRKSRGVIDNNPDIIPVRISSEQSAAADWETVDGGGMVTAGVGGPITGRGADLFVIDDYMKNSEEAVSETIREKHWEWWQSTASTRIEPGGLVVVIATRWHKNDLVGRLLKDSGGWPVEHIHLPAIADDTDTLGRRAGEPLWPWRFDLERLEKKKEGMEPYWWQTMYQGDPPKHGRTEWPQEYFENIVADESEWPDRFELTAIAVDPSKGRTEKSDYSAIVFVGLTRGIMWIDSIIERIPAEEICCRGVDMAVQYTPDLFGVESNAFQDLLAIPLDAECRDRNYPPLPISMIHNNVDKNLRISRVGPYLRRKLLRFRESVGNDLLLRQLHEWPLGDYDDGPDALEMAIRLLTQGQPVIEYGDEMIEI